MDRRDFLRVSGAALLASRLGFAQQSFVFRIGMESYSLRNFDLDRTLACYKELGLAFAEIYADKHMPFTADEEKQKAYKAKLGASGLTVWGFWCGNIPKDPEKSRTKFAFARAMGAKLLVGDPDPDSFDALEGLTKEYGVRFALHNHGPKSRYDKIGDVAKALEGRSDRIGHCADTGHWVRSGEDPAAAIRTFGARVLGVHLKDASAPNVYKILGQGKLDLVGTLRALKEVKFDGCLALEYEEKPDSPMEDIKSCFDALGDALLKM